MPRDDADRSAAIVLIASGLVAELLHVVEALTYVVIAYSSKPGEEAARKALDEIRRIADLLIDSLEPIASAADLDELRALALALDEDLIAFKPGRTRH